MATKRKKTKPEASQLVAIPLDDGSFGLAHLANANVYSAKAVLLGARAPTLEELGDRARVDPGADRRARRHGERHRRRRVACPREKAGQVPRENPQDGPQIVLELVRAGIPRRVLRPLEVERAEGRPQRRSSLAGSDAAEASREGREAGQESDSQEGARKRSRRRS